MKVIKTILNKMEIVNRVSTSQNSHDSSDVIAERTKQASENSEPIKMRVKLSDSVSVKAS